MARACLKKVELLCPARLGRRCQARLLCFRRVWAHLGNPHSVYTNRDGTLRILSRKARDPVNRLLRHPQHGRPESQAGDQLPQCLGDASGGTAMTISSGIPTLPLQAHGGEPGNSGIAARPRPAASHVTPSTQRQAPGSEPANGPRAQLAGLQSFVGESVPSSGQSGFRARALSPIEKQRPRNHLPGPAPK